MGPAAAGGPEPAHPAPVGRPLGARLPLQLPCRCSSLLLPFPHNNHLLPSGALPHHTLCSVPPALSSAPHPPPQGAHQRFFRQLVMGGKVDALVEMAQAALDAGQCVVIGLCVLSACMCCCWGHARQLQAVPAASATHKLRGEQAGGRHLHSVHLSSPPASRSAQPSPACRQSTGEAVTEQLREVAGDELDDLASAPRLILEGFLRKHWPPGNTGEMEVNVDAVIFQVGRSVGACRHHLNACPRGRQNEQA